MRNLGKLGVAGKRHGRAQALERCSIVARRLTSSSMSLSISPRNTPPPDGKKCPGSLPAPVVSLRNSFGNEAPRWSPTGPGRYCGYRTKCRNSGRNARDDEGGIYAHPDGNGARLKVRVSKSCLSDWTPPSARNSSGLRKPKPSRFLSAQAGREHGNIPTNRTAEHPGDSRGGQKSKITPAAETQQTAGLPAHPQPGRQTSPSPASRRDWRGCANSSDPWSAPPCRSNAR